MSSVREGDATRITQPIRRFTRAENPLGMWIFAHRGDSYHAPENTLEAAERGLVSGADAWEFDVQLSRDGVPIVLHDDSLARTTNVSIRFANDPRSARGYLAADFTFDEIQTLDAGSWFIQPNGPFRSAAWFGTLDSLHPNDLVLYGSGQVRIPTLSDALAWTVSHGWRANVELKSFPLGDIRRIERVVEVLRRSGMEGRLVVSSFDHSDLVAIREIWRDVPLGALVATPLAKVPEYLALLGATSYHVSREVIGLESLDYRSYGEVGIMGTSKLTVGRYPVHVYTVNDPSEVSVLNAAGIDGIFTDDPVTIVRELRSPG